MRTTKQRTRYTIGLPEEAMQVLRWHVDTQLRTPEQHHAAGAPAHARRPGSRRPGRGRRHAQHQRPPHQADVAPLDGEGDEQRRAPARVIDLSG
jgi:hypothetical protein